MKLLMIGFLFLTGFFSKDTKPKPDCVEVIDPDCFCILIYDPVCGCNDVTYGNACVAECSGITDYKKGECKIKKSK